MNTPQTLHNDIVWVNETQSEIYISCYKHTPENPLANIMVKELITMITYKPDNDYGPCYSKVSKDFTLEQLQKLKPFSNVVNQSLYTAMHAAKNAELRLGEINLKLQNNMVVNTLIGDDLWLSNSNESFNKQIIAYCFAGIETQMQPFSIYMLNDDKTALVETPYSTHNISDFILGNPQLFFDMFEE